MDDIGHCAESSAICRFSNLGTKADVGGFEGADDEPRARAGLAYGGGGNDASWRPALRPVPATPGRVRAIIKRAETTFSCRPLSTTSADDILPKMPLLA